jgi:hypothetical protein
MLFLHRPPNRADPSTGPMCLQIGPTSGDSARSRTPDGKQPRPAICATEKLIGTTRAHILDHIIVTLRGDDLQVSWRRFVIPPHPKPEQQQAFPPDPPPPMAWIHRTTTQPKIHRPTTSASTNQVSGSRVATQYESRSKLIGITFILVTPIPHIVPPCYNYNHTF